MTTTPTPSQPANPSSASKKTASHISTPSHLNYSSPAPRSIPSPVTTRKDHADLNAQRKEQAGRTPVNHPTNGSTGSKTLGGTPMFASLSAQGNPASTSPGTNLLASFSTPIGLGVGFDAVFPPGAFASIANLDAPVPLVRGPQWNDAEERRAKMRKISDILARSRAKGGEEGIARASRRVGFQIDIDAERLTNEEREKKVGNRSISIAGNKLVIDIALKSHIVQSVEVTFDSVNTKLTEVQAPAAAGVLMDNLRAPSGIPLLANLEHFQLNLERLAVTDRQSSGKVNCFEALSGIYTSLSRLYEQERRFASEMAVMCKKSGRPRLHANGRLGLAIEYWRHLRHGPDSDTLDSSFNDQIHRLQIEVEPDDRDYLPPLTVSEGWLPEQFELSAEDTGPVVIPWMIPATADVEDDNIKTEMETDDSGKKQNLKFVARLDPPVMLEFTTAMALFDSFQMPRPNVASFPGLYHARLINPTASSMTATEPAESHIRIKDVLVPSDGEETNVKHINTLFSLESQEYGWPISSLEFSHPRQLVEILPILRQWAQLGHLIRTAFPQEESQQKEDIFLMNRSITAQDFLQSPVKGVSGNDKNENVHVDISIQCLPRPNLTLTFPDSRSGTPLTTAIQVLPNADIVVYPGNETIEDDNAKQSASKKIAKVLDRCADLDIWVEWLRRYQ